MQGFRVEDGSGVWFLALGCLGVVALGAGGLVRVGGFGVRSNA